MPEPQEHHRLIPDSQSILVMAAQAAAPDPQVRYLHLRDYSDWTFRLGPGEPHPRGGATVAWVILAGVLHAAVAVCHGRDAYSARVGRLASGGRLRLALEGSERERVARHVYHYDWPAGLPPRGDAVLNLLRDHVVVPLWLRTRYEAEARHG